MRKLLGAGDAATGVAALMVFSCLAGGDYDRGAERLGPKHAAEVVSYLLKKLPEVCALRVWTLLLVMHPRCPCRSGAHNLGHILHIPQSRGQMQAGSTSCAASFTSAHRSGHPVPFELLRTETICFLCDECQSG